MHVVDVCAFYTPHGGGVRTYVERKLAWGAANGHAITIIVPGVDNRVEQRSRRGRIVHLAAPAFPLDRRYRYFDDPRAVHDALDAARPDVVEASSPWRSASIVGDWQGGAPRSLVMHADPLAAHAYRWFGGIADRTLIDRGFDRYWRHLRRLSEQFDHVVCANPLLAGRLRAGGVANVVTIAMGVDPGVFSPALRDGALRASMLARCGLPPEAKLLIGVGRHGPEKRWPLVIDACIAAGLRQPIGLILVGDGRDRRKLQRHIGGNPHVQLIAPISDRREMATLLASSDALIHGCEAETFGLVAAEAAASGLPLIVPDDGGSAALAKPQCSEIYAAGDGRSAAAAIGRLFARNPVAVSEAARANAHAARTMDQHLAELFDLYRRDLRGLRAAA